MAGDDILWKNVEAIQKQSPAAPEPVARRPEMSRERIADKVMASPSSGSANDVDTFPPNGSTHTNGSIAVSSASQRLPIRLPVKTSERTAALPCGQLLQVPGRPTRRRPERYAFQFWSDQITRLKQLRRMLNLANDPEERTEVTLSDLVREAVDEYLDRQTQPSGTERPAGSPRHITGRAYGRTASTMNSHFYHQFILIDFRLLEDRRFLKFLGSSEFATYLVLRRNVWRSAKPHYMGLDRLYGRSCQLVSSLTREKIADVTGVALDNISRHLSGLEQKGVIRRLRTGRQNIYVLGEWIDVKGDGSYRLEWFYMEGAFGVSKDDLMQTIRSVPTVPSDQGRRKASDSNRQENRKEKSVDNGVFAKLQELSQPRDKTDHVTQQILDELQDGHSEPFYRLVAAKVPEDEILRALAEVRADGAEHPARLFTFKMKRYALNRLKQLR